MSGYHNSGHEKSIETVMGLVNIASVKIYEVQQIQQNGSNSVTNGDAGNISGEVEIYTQVIIRQIF
jgi:hypothetical protein